jgi:glycosyltransferase involved in cell wall biosynthesis
MADIDTKSSAGENEPREQIRLALLVDRHSLRDYSASLRHFLVALADEAYAAAVICPPGVDTISVLCPSVEFIGYPLIRIPLFIRQNRSVLMERLEKFKPTVLHCFGSGKARLARIIANQLGIPYVITFNHIGARVFKPLIYPGHCTTLIASSRAIAEYLKKAYPSYGLRIRHINLSTFIDDNCACFSKSHEIASLIVAQRLDRVAHFEPLLNAVRHLILDGYEFVLAIVGSGSAEGKIHELIRRLGLAQIVSLIPDMQPMRSIFAGADIFIQPDCRSDFNSYLLEAMSVGMAVATCDDCLDDMLIADRTAVFFDSTDELSIYDCLRALLTKRSFAKKIAAGGQEYLRRHHTVSRMTTALIQTYQSAQQKYKQGALV